jgi:general secretion pathway protein J
MKAIANRKSSAEAGFTLVEALVATVLMGMILAALATITAQWLPNWSRGFARVQRTELLAIALERLAGDLAVAEFVAPNRRTPKPLFEGSELGVAFVRTASGPNLRPGLEVVRFAEIADRQGLALVRTRASFAPGAASADQFHFTNPVVLLRAPYRVTFAYAGRDGVWTGSWLEARELPTAVRISVRDAASERLLSVSTTALVHTQIPSDCVTKKEDRRCGRGARRDAAGAQADATANGNGLAGSR